MYFIFLNFSSHTKEMSEKKQEKLVWIIYLAQNYLNIILTHNKNY